MYLENSSHCEPVEAVLNADVGYVLENIIRTTHWTNVTHADNGWNGEQSFFSVELKGSCVLSQKWQTRNHRMHQTTMVLSFAVCFKFIQCIGLFVMTICIQPTTSRCVWCRRLWHRLVLCTCRDVFENPHLAVGWQTHHTSSLFTSCGGKYHQLFVRKTWFFCFMVDCWQSETTRRIVTSRSSENFFLACDRHTHQFVFELGAVVLSFPEIRAHSALISRWQLRRA